MSVPTHRPRRTTRLRAFASRALPILVLPVGALLGACGGGDDPAGTSPSTAPDGTGSPTAEPPLTATPPAPVDEPVGPGDGVAPDDAPSVTYVSAVRTLGELATGPLPPLPAPSLTPAPGLDDEPGATTGARDTAVTFAAVEERRAQPEDPWRTISEAEFAEDPPPPVLTFPPGYDPATNAPTYFEGLDDVTIVAGERFELLLDPIDPEGGIAGQYVESLPPGARYVDNFDTTRSIVWRPLEPDVGITALTVVTNDPREPLLRNAYTIRIKVVLPDDPSTIENRPPGIDRVDPQTVRVGDPVVIGFKGTDPNATVPTLTLREPPAGSTFVPDPHDPRIRVLRFVPDAVGPLEIDVVARDARDPRLTAEQTVTVDVRAREDFRIDGPRLKDLGADRDLSIGFAATSRFHTRADGALYADLAAAEFDAVVPENAMKWDALNPVPGHYRWAEADNIVAFAEARGLSVRGHTLVWYTQLPTWVRESPPVLREGHMREHIERVLARYADDVPVWDVVNEALEEDGTLRDSVWQQAMGPAHIDIAFRQARLSAPDATLLYNDYDIAEAGPKADGLHRLLADMDAAGTPIDGVGFQMHLRANFDRFDEVAENFRRVAALGLEVWITELDVAMDPGQTEAMQAAVYAGVVDTCLAEPACRSLTTWGFTDRYSWRKPRTPLPLDADYAPKPAYRALQDALSRSRPG